MSDNQFKNVIDSMSDDEEIWTDSILMDDNPAGQESDRELAACDLEKVRKLQIERGVGNPSLGDTVQQLVSDYNQSIKTDLAMVYMNLERLENEGSSEEKSLHKMLRDEHEIHLLSMGSQITRNHTIKSHKQITAESEEMNRQLDEAKRYQRPTINLAVNLEAQADLAIREADVAKREAEVARREAEVARREAEVVRREALLEQ